MKKPVTMKVVAEKAGVTQATVSMSLAHSPRIPVATRQRIQRLARQLGYRPNPYVATLMRSRRLGRAHADRPIIALINCYDTLTGWRETDSATVRQMLTGAIECAQDRGYRVEEFWLHQDGMTAGRFSEMLFTRSIQGVLLGPLAIGASIPKLTWDYFAPVRLGVPLPDSTLTSVCNDHFSSCIQVIRSCRHLGYLRPGLVLLEAHLTRFQGRWDGGLMVTERLLPGTEPVKPLLLKTWTDFAPLKGWLQQERPDVIITPTPGAVQNHLRGLGCQVPQDLGLASLACAQLGDPTSGIFQNGHLIGATGIDMVIGLLERNERGLPTQTRTVMIEGVWNPGKTLRPLVSPAGPGDRLRVRGKRKLHQRMPAAKGD